MWSIFEDFGVLWELTWAPFWHHLGTLEPPKSNFLESWAQGSLEEALQTDLGCLWIVFGAILGSRGALFIDVE